MMEFLGRCFKIFKVAFWGIKSSEDMEEVLREILPAFDHLEGHKPIFCGLQRIVRSYKTMPRLHCVGNL